MFTVSTFQLKAGLTTQLYQYILIQFALQSTFYSFKYLLYKVYDQGTEKNIWTQEKEITGGQRKLHNEKLYNAYSSLREAPSLLPERTKETSFCRSTIGILQTGPLDNYLIPLPSDLFIPEHYRWQCTRASMFSVTALFGDPTD